MRNRVPVEEQSRTYHFDKDYKVTICNPKFFISTVHGNHILWDSNGNKYEIPSGWKYLKIVPHILAKTEE